MVLPFFFFFLTDNMTRNAGGWNLTIDIIKWGIMEYIKSLMTGKLLYCSLIPNLCYEKININTKEVGFLFVSLFFILFYFLYCYYTVLNQRRNSPWQIVRIGWVCVKNFNINTKLVGFLFFYTVLKPHINVEVAKLACWVGFG